MHTSDEWKAIGDNVVAKADKDRLVINIINSSNTYTSIAVSDIEYLKTLQSLISSLIKNDEVKHVNGNAQLVEQIILDATITKNRLSKKYTHNVDHNCSEMNGNMDWARIEGAVAIIETIRKYRK